MWLDHLRQDLVGAARGIARYPIAALVAVLSLAGGIGATTATLIIRDVVFRRPPALYHAPGELSRVQIGSPDRPIMPIGNHVPSALYAAWRDSSQASTWVSMAAATETRVRSVRTTDREESVRVRSVTPEFFSVLGVSSLLGRTFSPSAEVRLQPDPGDARAVVLSHRLWRQLFDGRPDVAGQVVWIENEPHAVIGVMPERFWFSTMDGPIWTLLDLGTLSPETALEVVIRRQPDVYALTRAMRAAGGGGSVFGPNWAAFTVPVLIVVVIGSLATWIPSRRALRIDPAVLLRTT
jgi:hypothetical protein